MDKILLVKLPFKKTEEPLEESFTQAKRRFFSLERRLIANPELHEKCRSLIEVFLGLNHLELIPDDETSKPPSQHY